MDGSRTRVVETRYDVTLVSAENKPQRVARIIAEFTDQTRRQAMGTIETAPVLILQGVSYATAEGARMALKRQGATVEVRAYEIETAGRPPQSSTPPTSRQNAWTIVGWAFLILFLVFIIFVVVASVIVGNLGSPTF
jgi:Ribosomal protein L7/L12 C-terminal domain